MGPDFLLPMLVGTPGETKDKNQGHSGSGLKIDKLFFDKKMLFLLFPEWLTRLTSGRTSKEILETLKPRSGYAADNSPSCQ